MGFNGEGLQTPSAYSRLEILPAAQRRLWNELRRMNANM